MRFYRFMKYWSLIWMVASIGAALGCLMRKGTEMPCFGSFHAH